MPSHCRYSDHGTGRDDVGIPVAQCHAVIYPQLGDIRRGPCDAVIDTAFDLSLQRVDERVPEIGTIRAAYDDIRHVAEIRLDVIERHDPFVPGHDTDTAVLQCSTSDSFHFRHPDVEDAVCLRTDVLDADHIIVVNG